MHYWQRWKPLQLLALLVRFINNARRRLHDHGGEARVRQSCEESCRREASHLLDAATLELVAEGLDHRHLGASLGRLLDLRHHHINRQRARGADSTTHERRDHLLLVRQRHFRVASLEHELFTLHREEETRRPVRDTLHREHERSLHQRRHSFDADHVHSDPQRHHGCLHWRHLLAEHWIGHHARLEQQCWTEHKALEATADATGQHFHGVLTERSVVREALQVLLGQRMSPREHGALGQTLDRSPWEEPIPDTSDAFGLYDLARESPVRLTWTRLLHDLDEFEKVAESELVAERDAGTDDQLDGWAFRSLGGRAQRQRAHRMRGGERALSRGGRRGESVHRVHTDTNKNREALRAWW